MRAPLAVLVVLALAGCTGAPTQTAAIDDVLPGLPGLKGIVSDIVTVIDPAGGHGEPSFGAAPDGTLFANGNGGSGGGVYRSQDDGRTWERIATPVEPIPNMDPDLAVDRDGTVWFSALYIACTATASSQDLGDTWVSNLAACNTVAADRQYVVPTEGGTAYLYSHQLPTFYQMAAKTTDYGRTWIPTGPVELPDHHLMVNGGTGWGGGGFWNAATGTVFFTWTYSTSGVTDTGSNPGYAFTRDEGLTWTMGTAPGAGGEQLGLGLVVGAADDAGNVYLAWGEELDESTAIYMARSTDDGDTWEGPFRVDDTTGSKVFPAITAGPDGKVAIAYYEADEPAFPSDVSEEGSWNVTLAWTDDALAAEPVFTYGTLNTAPVKTGAICIDGTTCQGGREFLDYFQVHRLPDGRVGAIFNALEGETLLEVYAATRDAVLA